VEAALKQTHPPDEIIVVDDKSTDESVDVLSQLPVQLICHENNQGPAVARNTLLLAASGEIVVYLDSDAYPEQGMIAALLDAYQRPSKNKLAGVGGRGIETYLETVYDHWRNAHARQDFGLIERDGVPYLFGLCMSFKRQALMEVNGFDTFFPINAGEDMDLGYRLARKGYILRYTPDAYVYHQHWDDELKLKRVQYNWYYWSYLAKKRNHHPTWYLYAGSLRRLVMNTLEDLFIRRSTQLARLDIEIFTIKIRALRNAARHGIPGAA
jgi:GT2 family glycosyltransferase